MNEFQVVRSGDGVSIEPTFFTTELTESQLERYKRFKKVVEDESSVLINHLSGPEVGEHVEFDEALDMVNAELLVSDDLDGLALYPTTEFILDEEERKKYELMYLTFGQDGVSPSKPIEVGEYLVLSEPLTDHFEEAEEISISEAFDRLSWYFTDVEDAINNVN